MKTVKLIGLAVAAILSGSAGYAQSVQEQEQAKVAGDNLSLGAALELFKQSSSPEDFERRINAEGNDVNNLDLNGDGEIDYIRVISRKENDAHVFIMQAMLSESENQDIAVIELEKTGKESAMIQIIGDEDIFGEQVIVEPQDEAEDTGMNYVYSKNVHGPLFESPESGSRVAINVWFWPSVRFVYGPAYITWVSPCSWRSRPVWWRPCRPVYYHAYYPRRIYYNRYYPVVHTHRVVRAHQVYVPHRTNNYHQENRYYGENRRPERKYRNARDYRGGRDYNGRRDGRDGNNGRDGRDYRQGRNDQRQREYREHRDNGQREHGNSRGNGYRGNGNGNGNGNGGRHGRRG